MEIIFARSLLMQLFLHNIKHQCKIFCVSWTPSIINCRKIKRFSATQKHKIRQHRSINSHFMGICSGASSDIHVTISYNPNFYMDCAKRYFMIDKQIAPHFVHYGEYSYYHLSFYATQMINPFLTSRIWANPDKGLGF